MATIKQAEKDYWDGVKLHELDPEKRHYFMRVHGALHRKARRNLRHTYATLRDSQSLICLIQVT